MSPAGVPEFAVTDGAIVPAAGTDEDGWNRLGGYTVMLEAAYDVGPIRKGDLFYYAHLDHESSLRPGTEVRAGQQIGVAGDTGEGPQGTRGLFPPHLHLGWYDAGSASSRSKVESGAINPYPLLLWLEQNGGAVSGGADTSYCEAPQGPVPGPAPNSPGERPDLDTGNDRDARPSPVISENKPRHNHPSNHKNDAGQVQNPDPGEQVEKPDDRDQSEQPDDTDQSDQPYDGEQVEKPDNSGQVDEPDDSGQVEQPDDGEPEKPDDSVQDENADGGEPDEKPDDGKQAEQPDDSGQVENPDDGAATGGYASTPEEPGEDGNQTARPAEDEKPRGGVSRPRDLPRPGWSPSLVSIITSVFSQGERENPSENDRGASEANSKQDEGDSRKARPEATEPEDPPILKHLASPLVDAPSPTRTRTRRTPARRLQTRRNPARTQLATLPRKRARRRALGRPPETSRTSQRRTRPHHPAPTNHTTPRAPRSQKLIAET